MDEGSVPAVCGHTGDKAPIVDKHRIPDFSKCKYVNVFSVFIFNYCYIEQYNLEILSKLLVYEWRDRTKKSGWSTCVFMILMSCNFFMFWIRNGEDIISSNYSDLRTKLQKVIVVWSIKFHVLLSVIYLPWLWPYGRGVLLR